MWKALKTCTLCGSFLPYETNSAQHGNVDFSAMLYVGVSCYSSQQYYVCCLKVFRDRILYWIPPKQQQIYFLRSDRELGHIFWLSKINSIQPRKPRGGFSLAGFPLNTYYLLLLLLVAHQICTAKKKKCLRYAVTLKHTIVWLVIGLGDMQSRPPELWGETISFFIIPSLPAFRIYY